MVSVIGGTAGGITLSTDPNGRTVVRGLEETRQKFLQMGGDRNLFDKWIKEASLVAAREATATAPRISGALALSVRGFASKKVEIRNFGTGAVDRRMVFGGVMTAGSVRVPYARAVSLGTYRQAGQRSVSGDRVWRTTVRGKGNPYMVKAREKKKSYMVTLLNFKLGQYFKQKGFDTHGL